MFDEGYIVFSGADCPKCEDLKTKLKQQDIYYKEYDIWKNPEALKFIMSKGYRSIPQLFFNGEKVENV